MSRLGSVLKSSLALAALALASLASAAISDADMERLLKNPRVFFAFECRPPVTLKFRIEDHTTAAQLKRKIDDWKECVRDYDAQMRAFVELEWTEFPALVERMSEEQRERYRKAVAEAADAELAVVGPRVEETSTLLNEIVVEYRRRASSIRLTDVEFAKIEARFARYQYDCERPNPEEYDLSEKYRGLFLSEGDRFEVCSSNWYRDAEALLKNGGNRAAVVSDAEYAVMTPDQKERIDYLVSTAYVVQIPLGKKMRREALDAHREIVDELFRLDR